MMRGILLGTGGYFPNDVRHTACVLLPECGVAFDAGSGAFRLPQYLQSRTLQIFLSHAHLDHICGLTTLLPTMLNGELSDVSVHATQRTIDAVRTHLFSEPVFPVEPSFDYVPLTEEVETPAGFVTHCHLKHPGGSIGYRLTGATGSIAYITDTTVDGSYTEFVRGVDLLIHECYFPDQLSELAQRTGHSTTTPVAQLACDANVGRLILVHVDPTRAEGDSIDLATARAIFPDTVLAEDVMEFVYGE